MRLLREAEMDLGTELTLRVQNREIIVTAKSADQVTDESRVSAFEQCLADVLARRSSALQRLAE